MPFSHLTSCQFDLQTVTDATKYNKIDSSSTFRVLGTIGVRKEHSTNYVPKVPAVSRLTRIWIGHKPVLKSRSFLEELSVVRSRVQSYAGIINSGGSNCADAWIHLLIN